VNGEPVLPISKGDFGIAEIITDKLDAKYCPGENISIKVDVLSRKSAHEGQVELKVVDDSGKFLYLQSKNTAIVNPDSIKSIEFNFKAPYDMSEKSLQLSSILYSEDEKIDEKSMELVIDESLCPLTPIGGGIDWMLLFLIGIALLFIIALIYFSYNYLINRGEVEINKTVDGELIKVTVENNTRRDLRECVLRDAIIDGAEVNVITAGVLRKGEELVWNIGKIPTGGDVVLEYKMKKAGLLPRAVFTWHSGKKETE